MKCSFAVLCGVLCLCMFMFAGCSMDEQDASLRPPEPRHSRRLKVVGRELRDGLDRQVLLRGFSAGGGAKMPPFLPFEVSAGDFSKRAGSYFAAHGALGVGESIKKCEQKAPQIPPHRATLSSR